MKSVKNLSVVVLISSFLVACGTTSQKAPIEDRSSQHRPPVAGNKPNAADSRSFYVVKKGDTLRQIASEQGQSYSDIIAWNNLTNPNDIKVGRSLRVAPVDAVSGVSAIGSSGVEVRPLGAPGSNEVSLVSDNNKNGPRADKRPYSDATLAEMQKNDSVSDTNVAKTTDKPLDKPTPPAVVDEIVWIWPAEGKVVTNFDDNKNKGIDLSGTLGQDVFAAAAGTVMYAGSGIRGYGNLVIIKHSNNFLSAYAHNKKILVKEKQAISKGQKIAEMGSSDSDSVKLHFEIRQQGKPVDPMKFLPAR